MLENTVIIAGPASIELARSISKILDVRFVEPELKIFSDGESKIRIPSVNNQHCIIVQSLYPPIDRHLIQLLMLIHKCKKENASKITVIIPYMAYARQDKEFLKGEIISFSLIAELIENCGTTEVITVDIHNEFSLSYFSISIKNISAIPVLAEYVRDNKIIDNSIIVSPDKGGIIRATKFAELLRLQMLSLKKIRDRKTGLVSIEEKLEFDVSGRDAILIDDMISTGDSIVKACGVLKNNNIRKIIVLCSHAILVDNALEKITNAGVQEIISTNSIPSTCSKVDLAQMLSNVILKFK
ncbi:MAG TPA: ribose-phosphate pyrophosphokinase [Nitrososphaeraceae archaeon]|nr:ribose-phosphate pyrophosphokinase [Nitrososphaeraceae archaeon]